MTDARQAAQYDDTPRSAYRVLAFRATAATVMLLLALAAIAWWYTVGQAHTMSSMVQGLAFVGTAMPFAVSVPVFMGMWMAMMVAMMFPAAAPIVLLHRMVARQRGETLAATGAFVGGYLLIWTATGLLPLTALVAFRHAANGSGWVDPAGGAVLMIAGAYQFSRWKGACLRTCRSPLTFLMTHDFSGGAAGALRTGMSHGLYCLGCCWALMAVLFVVGLMNLAWMAAIAVIFLAEKNWRHGIGLTKLAGMAIVAVGTAVMIHPALLQSIAAGRIP
jgi:predicted metal-binding membrane protein